MLPPKPHAMANQGYGATFRTKLASSRGACKQWRMSKKRSKTPSTSHKTTRKTEAPKVLSRPSVEAPVEVSLEALPVIDASPLVEATVVELRTAPDHHQIARRAFAKFVARGYVHGHHIKDWLAAEAELLAR